MYTLILGKDFKDCKTNAENIRGKYCFIIKPKHLVGIPFNRIVETENFVENPNYKEIIHDINEIIKTHNYNLKPLVEKSIVDDKSGITIDNFENDILEPVPEPVPENVPEPETKSESEPEPEPETKSESEPVSEDVPEPETKSESEPETEKVPEPETEKVPEPETEKVPELEPELPEPETEKVPELESEISEIRVDLVKNISEDDEGEIQPVGEKPRGWHLRKEFIDEVGNIFHKGKYVGKVI